MYGTYAFKHMSFEICNAPATYKRYMIAIFWYGGRFCRGIDGWLVQIKMCLSSIGFSIILFNLWISLWISRRKCTSILFFFVKIYLKQVRTKSYKIRKIIIQGVKEEKIEKYYFVI